MAQIQPAGIFLFGEISAGTAQQLTDDNPLGAAGNKCALCGHQRHIAQENILFFNFTGGFN
jgi:hypothetical protein